MVLNDILLIPSRNNNYDWFFEADDVREVRNDDKIKNAVIQLVRLKPDEIDTEIGINEGNRAYNYLKYKPTEHVLLLIKEHILNECRNIPEVSDASLDLVLNGEYTTVNITLLKENGEEVVVNDLTL